MTNPKQIQNEDVNNPAADVAASNDVNDMTSVISNEALSQKEKSKAKVRITAYQARILMDGVTPILDDIDKRITDAALHKNLDEVSYKLEGIFIKNPYYTEIKSSLDNRGFYVNAQRGETYVMLKIRWQTGN